MKKSWEQLENESAKAFRIFSEYLSMETGKRTLLGAYRKAYKNKEKHKGAPPYIVKWSSDFKWEQRVRDYDHYIGEEYLDEVTKHTRKDARKWARRREKVREEEWEIREKLKAKIDQMLAAKFNAKDFKFKDLPPILKCFVEISRLSTDMPTSKKEISVKDIRDEVKKLSTQLGVDVDVDEAIALATQLVDSEKIIPFRKEA